MSLFDSIVDPTDLDEIRGVIRKGPRPDDLVSLDLQYLAISDSASSQLMEIIGKISSSFSLSSVAVLMDEQMILRLGADFKSDLVKQIQEKYTVSEAVLRGEHVYVDQRTIDLATKMTAVSDLIVSIGGGTISDIGKLAAMANDIPLVCLQTAASVDGYTDNVSVVLKDGAKRTVPSKWPTAVIADISVIKDAPIELNTAGLGEALSLFTAPADWWLANQMGFDSTFHETPKDLLLSFVGDPTEWAKGLSDGDLQATEQLTKVLAIRGIGTGIAGTTACLSGVEHLISHMLDMRAVSSHNTVGLHGAQVGVASVVAAEAWNYFLEKLQDGISIVQPDSAEVKKQVEEVFNQLDESGKLAAECWVDVSSKLDRWMAVSSEANKTLNQWIEHPEQIEAIAPSAELVAKSLSVSGSPMQIADLESWIDESIWSWAVRNCHLMRNRLTVVDLLFFIGCWNEEDQKEVIGRASRRVSAVTNG